MVGSVNGGTPKWIVCNGKSHQNGWFGGTPLYGDLHIWIPPHHLLNCTSSSWWICQKIERLFGVFLLKFGTGELMNVGLNLPLKFEQKHGSTIQHSMAIRQSWLLLVGGLEHFLCSISYMGCHPSHWLSYVSRWAHCTTNQLKLLRSMSISLQKAKVLKVRSWDFGTPGTAPTGPTESWIQGVHGVHDRELMGE